jgi:dimethylglycine dehydrogenase
MAVAGNVMQLDMYGDLVAAEVIAQSVYDPDHSLMRG